MFCAIGAFTFTRSLFSVNGGWSSWYSWSSYGSCSKTCGYGTKKYKRWRYCNNPTPKNGGRGCYGSSTTFSYKSCLVRYCPIGMYYLLFSISFQNISCWCVFSPSLSLSPLSLSLSLSLSFSLSLLNDKSLIKY